MMPELPAKTWEHASMGHASVLTVSAFTANWAPSLLLRIHRTVTAKRRCCLATQRVRGRSTAAGCTQQGWVLQSDT